MVIQVLEVIVEWVLKVTVVVGGGDDVGGSGGVGGGGSVGGEGFRGVWWQWRGLQQHQ